MIQSQHKTDWWFFIWSFNHHIKSVSWRIVVVFTLAPALTLNSHQSLYSHWIFILLRLFHYKLRSKVQCDKRVSYTDTDSVLFSLLGKTVRKHYTLPPPTSPITLHTTRSSVTALSFGWTTQGQSETCCLCWTMTAVPGFFTGYPCAALVVWVSSGHLGDSASCPRTLHMDRRGRVGSQTSNPEVGGKPPTLPPLL